MHHDTTLDSHDSGLAHDLAVLHRQALGRRHALRWLLGAGAATLVGCGGDGGDSSSTSTATGGSGGAGSGGSSSSSGSCTPLRRVLDNLIGNALRYAGHARVRIQQDGGATVLVVEDSGPGIPQVDLERVLQPFRRLESSRNPATGGAGLGLHIANELARREGATLSLHNRPEGGLRAELRWRTG